MKTSQHLSLINTVPPFSVCEAPIGDVAEDVSATSVDGELMHFSCVAEGVFYRDGLHYELVSESEGSSALRHISEIAIERQVTHITATA